MSLKPVCVPCARFFRPKKNGFYFIEGMPVGDGCYGNRAEPGTSQPERWEPYKLWSGDLWECQGCGTQIVQGFGRGPIAEQHQDDFARLVRDLGAKLQVNDC